MGEAKRRAASDETEQGFAYLVPGELASKRCAEMLSGIAMALTGIPGRNDNDELCNDRALACAIVAAGEISRIRNDETRNAILRTVGPLLSDLVAGNIQQRNFVEGAARQMGISVFDFIKHLEREGISHSYKVPPALRRN